MPSRKTLGAASAFVAILLSSASAQAAALFRAYVESAGSDANPCTLSAPCRLLPAALAAVADGGEIWMLDSANYNTGPVNITKSVTILAVPGALGSVLALGGNAIDIATAGVKVALRNLVIVPFPGGGGTGGINMTAGAGLTVEKCLIANLPGTGIVVNTAASVRITDTTIRDNGFDGLLLQDGARATVTRATISGNANEGVIVFGSVASTTTTADIADSTIDGNLNNGVVASSFNASAVIKVSVRDSRAVRNANYGVIAQSSAGASVTLSVSNNIISNNGSGIAAFSAGSKVWASGNTVSDNNGIGLSNNGGLFESACNNAVRNNTSADTTGTITGVPVACSANTFSVTVTPTGSGTVTSTPAGINCGADCTENYIAGTVVTLTATASTGSTFSGWGGACSGTGTCVVTMDAAKSVSASFTLGIFVSVAGANTANCGLVFTDPCQTISFGIVRAVQAAKPNVYVQAGTYNEVVVLLSGVNVWGGYDFNWQHGPYTNPANRVTVVGKQDTTAGGDGEYLTVRAHDLIVPVTIDDLVLQGPNAQGVGGVSGLDGRSSYVVHAKAAELSLTHVQVAAGNGASGATGSAGLDAVVVDVQSFMVGGNGGNGDEFSTTCNSSSRGGGGGAAGNSCAASPSSRSMNAGGGGRGGTMDTNCSIFTLDSTARPGDNGGSAAFVFGSFGAGGFGGSGGDSCGPTTGGGPGLIANGGAGGANAGGYLGGTNNVYWYARSGSSGSTGENGSGGGGGGGGGGCDVGTDAYGGGGGGGGAGGCAARGGGGGGGGGGGSFGIFVLASSTVNLESCDLFRGVGGTGGAAGGGGRGQSGGGGGAQGANPGSALAGAGGNGAHGGHGGGGGGGQGGRSIGIVTDGSPINGTCTQSQGAGGGGGAGGVSAPNAPVSERDGANGGGGLAGTLEDLRVCSGSSC